MKPPVKKTKYRFSFIDLSSIAFGLVIKAHNRMTGETIRVSPQTAGLLLHCDQFHTLEKHAALYTNRYPRFKNKEKIIIKRLEFFAERKFLTPEAPFIAGIKEKAATQTTDNHDQEKINQIQAIGIPTTNRPDELDRALNSFIANVKTSHRAPEFIIADDSNGLPLEKNREIIEKYQKIYGGTITHLDLGARQVLVDKLFNQGSIPKHVISFALLGDEQSQIRTGALRNAIMLYAAGKKILFVDDDVICNVHMPVNPTDEPSKKTLMLSSAPPRQSWFFESYNEAIDYFPKKDLDYLAAHESLLGKSIGETINTTSELILNDEVGGFNNEFEKKLDQPFLSQTKIAVTYGGAVGDSWMRVHTPTMVGAPKNDRHQLWGSSEEMYQTYRTTPYVSRTAIHSTIYKGPNCISLNMGADLQGLMPPWAPLFRSQDAIFGYLLHHCFDDYVAGFIPSLVEHKRVESRLPQTNPIYTHTTIGKITVLAINILHSRSTFTNPAINLQFLGRNLIENSLNNKNELRLAIQEESKSRLLSFINYCKNLKTFYSDGPDYWQNDIDKTIKSIEEIVDNIAIAPFFWDVEGWETSSDLAWDNFMKWLEKFGELLVYWPEIFEKAKNENKNTLSN